MLCLGIFSFYSAKHQETVLMRKELSFSPVVLCALTLIGSVTRASDLDKHSPQAVLEALTSPIPVSAIEKATQMDDRILSQGAVGDTKVYLVTDKQLVRVQGVVARLLSAMGVPSKGWVVRVLDTKPKTVNAFVFGGNYVYVYTGLLEKMQNDDQLAVVLGHELGHSFLKHNIRKDADLSNAIATLAELAGTLSHGNAATTAKAVGAGMHNAYSREDEREADAFGVLVARRAGFDPIAGAAFFTEQAKIADAISAAGNQASEAARANALALKSQCETMRQQWSNGQAAKTQQNADIINQRCAAFTQAADAYNAQVAQAALDKAQAANSDHPQDQERIAAITALTDWTRGARTYQSLQAYPAAQRVAWAVYTSKSPILQRPTAAATSGNSSAASAANVASGTTNPDSGSLASAAKPASTNTAGLSTEDVKARLERLHTLFVDGTITEPEYEKRRAALVNQL